MQVFVALNVNREHATELVGVSTTQDGAVSLLSQARKEPLAMCQYGSPGVDRFDVSGIRDLCGYAVPCELAVPDVASHEAFLRRLLNPEDLGLAVTAEVRDCARECLGMPRVES